MKHLNLQIWLKFWQLSFFWSGIPHWLWGFYLLTLLQSGPVPESLPFLTLTNLKNTGQGFCHDLNWGYAFWVRISQKWCYAQPLLSIYPKELKLEYHTPMFSAALVTKPRSGDNLNVHWRINEKKHGMYVYTMAYYWDLKQNKILQYDTDKPRRHYAK